MIVNVLGCEISPPLLIVTTCGPTVWLAGVIGKDKALGEMNAEGISSLPKYTLQVTENFDPERVTVIGVAPVPVAGVIVFKIGRSAVIRSAGTHALLRRA